MLAIDHIVIASADPERDAKAFGEKHHLYVTPGGKHTNWGTYNYLSYLNNYSYIEWLGIFDEDLAGKSDNPLIRQLVEFFDAGKTGFMTFALRTLDMDEQKNHLNKNDIHFQEFPGSRKKPDGCELSWRMLFTNEKELPFLIEWGRKFNLPDDQSLINEKNLSKIIIPAHSALYEKTFDFAVNGHTIKVENGELLFTDSGELNFEISE